MFGLKVLYSIYATMIFAKINQKTIELSYYHFFEYSVIVKDLNTLKYLIWNNLIYV